MAANQEDVFPTSRDTLRAWRSAEKSALAEFGLHRRRTDDYEIWLDDAKEWEGGVTLPKRPGGAGESVVELGPPTFSIGHAPTEELIDRLKNPEAVPGTPVTLAGQHDEVLPADLDNRLVHISIWRKDQLEHAIETVSVAIERYILPWMRTKTDLSVMLNEFSTPRGNPGDEARRLERLAVLNHHLGNAAEAAAAIAKYQVECCSTGIKAIDEPGLRFAAGLTDQLSD